MDGLGAGLLSKDWTITMRLTYDDTYHGSYPAKAATVIERTFTLITTDPCKLVNGNIIKVNDRIVENSLIS